MIFFKVHKIEVAEEKEPEVENFNDIDSIAVYMKEHIGIDFDKQKVILASRIKTLCRRNNIYSYEAYLEALKNDSVFRQEGINYLTTNESFFYREFSQIQELVREVLQRNKPVSILCAPCATGEEPYSIVLALLEAGVSKDKFSVVGIDISSDAILKSLKAVYNKNTVRNLSPKLSNTYFSYDSKCYALNEEIKKQVKFECINIFENSFSALGKFDYIFSRNMLIYFDKATRTRAKNFFQEQLKDKSEPIFFGHADFPQ